MPPAKVTKEWFNGEDRPDEFGPVTIEFEEIPRPPWRGAGKPLIRISSVCGVVYPGSSKGRPSAPEPSNMLRVSMAENIPVKYRRNEKTGNNAYNTGIVDAEKGHVMAIELGGPDIPENIVPQWAKWQGCGEWRRMESEIRKLAEKGLSSSTKPGYYLQFHAVVAYGTNDGRALLKRLAFPSKFKVYVTRLDKTSKVPLASPQVMYDGSPSRSDIDDALALRGFQDLERLEYPENVPEYNDFKEKIKQGKRGKKRNAGHFGDTGQDIRYAPAPPAVRYPSALFNFEAYAVQCGVKLETNHQIGNLLPDVSEEDDPTYIDESK